MIKLYTKELRAAAVRSSAAARVMLDAQVLVDAQVTVSRSVQEMVQETSLQEMVQEASVQEMVQEDAAAPREACEVRDGPASGGEGLQGPQEALAPVMVSRSVQEMVQEASVHEMVQEDAAAPREADGDGFLPAAHRDSCEDRVRDGPASGGRGLQGPREADGDGSLAAKGGGVEVARDEEEEEAPLASTCDTTLLSGSTSEA